MRRRAGYSLLDRRENEGILEDPAGEKLHSINKTSIVSLEDEEHYTSKTSS